MEDLFYDHDLRLVAHCRPLRDRVGMKLRDVLCLLLGVQVFILLRKLLQLACDLLTFALTPRGPCRTHLGSPPETRPGHTWTLNPRGPSRTHLGHPGHVHRSESQDLGVGTLRPVHSSYPPVPSYPGTPDHLYWRPTSTFNFPSHKDRPSRVSDRVFLGPHHFPSTLSPLVPGESGRTGGLDDGKAVQVRSLDPVGLWEWCRRTGIPERRVWRT